MYAVRLKGTNHYVKRCVGYELLNEGSGSTWVKYPDIDRLYGGGPWIEDIAELLGVDLEDEDAMDELADNYGDQLFEVIEVKF